MSRPITELPQSRIFMTITSSTRLDSRFRGNDERAWTSLRVAESIDDMKAETNPYEPVIGLEVHAQLCTRSKIFCGCSATYGAAPNAQTCPVCLGLPGALPVLNQQAVEYAIRLILAVGGQVRPHSVFARKNYFYPDLPKGYQISQYDQPIGEGGAITIEEAGQEILVGLIRVHLEEDAGKLMHPEGGDAGRFSLVDMNRCGVPLLEIVSQPALRSPHQASLYLQKLHQILQYLGTCTGNMEEGALRCDANVSVRPASGTVLGTRTELKNLNSFRAVEHALNHEIERQIGILRDGGAIEQETMLWDDATQSVRPMRSKEESSDYRYFPDPDLLPLRITAEWIERVRSSLPELPDARAKRLERQYGIPAYDARVLTENRLVADYFEETARAHPDAKRVSNWIMTEVLRVLKDRGMSIGEFPIEPAYLAEMLAMVEAGAISGTMAKEVFEKMLTTGRSAKQIVSSEGLAQISDDAMLVALIEDVLTANPSQVADYQSGNRRVLAFFVGNVMKASQGKANPQRVSELLSQRLGRS